MLGPTAGNYDLNKSVMGCTPGDSNRKSGLRTVLPKCLNISIPRGKEMTSIQPFLYADQPAFIHTTVHFKEKEIGTQTSSNSLKVIASKLRSLHSSGSRTWFPNPVHSHIPFTILLPSQASCTLAPYCFSLDLFTF